MIFTYLLVENVMNSLTRPQDNGAEGDPRAPATGEEKLKELILYVCQKCADDPRFGSTKLNKLLFFADFFAYANLGEAVTGVEYQRLPKGPAPRRFVPVRDEMIENRELAIEIIAKKSYTQKRPVPLRKPNVSVFTAEQISLIDEVIGVFCFDNASEISEASHRMIGWKTAKDGETIPYSTIFISNAPLTEAEQERGLEIANLKGLALG